MLFYDTVGKKILTAATGLFLSIFLIVHLTGNLQLFMDDQGYSFNQYSHFMTTFLPIKVISYLLYLCILLHLILGMVMVIKNRKSRNVQAKHPYHRKEVSWASQNMGILGSLIFIFLVVHLSNFWYVYKFGNVPYVQYTTDVKTGNLIDKKDINTQENTLSHAYYQDEHFVLVVKDLYTQVAYSFAQLWIVVFYVIAMVALSFHLLHGFKSAFQTLGLYHVTYNKIIHFVGVWIFAILIPIIFASMPIFFFIKSLL